jgi:ParB family chromosome partitioning protein
MSLPTDKIKIAWFNPREVRSPEAIDALTESIRKNGILEPIHVAKVGGEYLCIEGGARLLAAQALNLEKVPVKLYEVSIEDAMRLTGELQLVKDDLTAAEKGKFIAMLIRKGVFKSVDDAAKYYGIPPWRIYEWVKEYKVAKIEVDEARLPKPVAKELVTLPKEVRRPIIQEVKDIPNQELQKKIVKEAKREIRERMAEEPEEVKEIVKKVIEKISEPACEIRVKGRESNYCLRSENQEVVIKRENATGITQGQISIPLRDLPILIRHLQKFAEHSGI